MSKSSFLNNKLLDKSNIALLCVLGMLAGFLVSRVALSISMMIFGLNALRNVNPLLWLRQKWWLLGLCWVMIYALTWFWSTDKGYWNMRFQVKLPILLLPVSFAFLPRFSTRQLQLYTIVLGVFLLSGACYSISFLVHHGAQYAEAYRTAHVLPTPARQDHIRFSLSIALYIIWCAFLWPQAKETWFRWPIALLCILLAVYLHVLAAKSGLLALYIFLIGWGLYTAFSGKKKLGISILISFAVLISIAFKVIPTFRERIGYMITSYMAYNQGDRTGIYGDLGRLMSYDIAVRLIKEHPLAGTGTGDMMTEMKKGYDRWYPQVSDENRLLPHDQFLTVALGCGIPAAFLFAIWALAPLAWLRRNRESFFFFIIWLILFLQLLIEPVLEVQFGVFVYLFFLLWQKHTLPRRSPEKYIYQPSLTKIT